MQYEFDVVCLEVETGAVVYQHVPDIICFEKE